MVVVCLCKWYIVFRICRPKAFLILCSGEDYISSFMIVRYLKGEIFGSVLHDYSAGAFFVLFSHFRCLGGIFGNDAVCGLLLNIYDWALFMDIFYSSEEQGAISNIKTFTEKGFRFIYGKLDGIISENSNFGKRSRSQYKRKEACCRQCQKCKKKNAYQLKNDLKVIMRVHELF